ncbi:MAG: hypothetical protein EOP59_09645 [Sphingomonadales bacterium]|nr:MAG: hypothetical protein EOP59_09645 [Sphingomonadales bacterium]
MTRDTVPPAPAFPQDDQAPGKDTSPWFVANAGLVLLNPFLPAFFDRLGLLERDTDGVPHLVGDAASRGVRLLQYCVAGSGDGADQQLVLNKLMCGLPAAAAIGEIEPTAAEREICDGLLAAIIGHWTAIGGTSPAGLRETFLQREGRLVAGEEFPELDVQRMTVDILLDRVPWSFRMIFHRWMAMPLRITW